MKAACQLGRAKLASIVDLQLLRINRQFFALSLRRLGLWHDDCQNAVLQSGLGLL